MINYDNLRNELILRYVSKSIDNVKDEIEVQEGKNYRDRNLKYSSRLYDELWRLEIYKIRISRYLTCIV